MRIVNYDLSKMPERVRTLVANSDTTLAELSLKIGQGVNYLYEAFGHERNIPLAKILQMKQIKGEQLISFSSLPDRVNKEDVGIIPVAYVK